MSIGEKYPCDHCPPGNLIPSPTPKIQGTPPSPQCLRHVQICSFELWTDRASSGSISGSVKLFPLNTLDSCVHDDAHLDAWKMEGGSILKRHGERHIQVNGDLPLPLTLGVFIPLDFTMQGPCPGQFAFVWKTFFLYCFRIQKLPKLSLYFHPVTLRILPIFKNYNLSGIFRLEKYSSSKFSLANISREISEICPKVQFRRAAL